MNSTPIEFHRIWIEQCDAAERIREDFDLKNALDYLIGQKLFSFLHAAERDPLFAVEVQAFVTKIRHLFTSEEIRDYLDHIEKTKYLAPLDLGPDMDDHDELDDPDEDEPWLENPVIGAEELLRFSRVRQLLQS